MLADLMEQVITDCRTHSIELRLVNDSFVTSEGAPCGGLFSHVDRSLTVAVAHADWVRFLAHEYGHMLQAVDEQFGMSLDPTHVEPNKPDPYVSLDKWLHSNKPRPKVAKEWLLDIIECELDAERRAVDLLTQHQCYPAESYIQQANLTLYAYAYAYHHKKWVLPDIDPKLAKVIPKRFCQTALEYLEIPKALERILTKKAT